MTYRNLIATALVICIFATLPAWPGHSSGGPSGSKGPNQQPTGTPTPRPPLPEAITNGDVSKVRELITAGTNLEEKYIGSTPIDLAVLYDKPEIVKILAAAGAEVNKIDALGQTPLFGAQSIATAEALVTHGAKIDLRNIMQQPLLLSVSYRHPDVAQYLVEHGADVQLTDDRNRTSVLMSACSQNQVDFVKFLLSRGMDVNQKSAHGETAFGFAASHGNTEVAKILIKHGADVNFKSTVDGRTALHTAAVDGYLDFVIILLKNGADHTIRDIEGLTPLAAASAYSPFPGRVSKPTHKQEVIRLLRELEEEK